MSDRQVVKATVQPEDRANVIQQAVDKLAALNLPPLFRD